MSQIELPEGWCEATLQDVADWGSGGTPSRKYAEYYDGDIPWVKTGDLGPKLLESCSESITELGVKNSSAKLFPKGSVALAMYGATIGRTSILGMDATTNQACAVGNPVKGLTSSEFLYYFLSNEKDRFIAKGKGGAQPNISQAVIKEHPFFLPPLAEQKVIADKLDILLAQVESIKARLERIPEILKQFRQSVLAAAVSGKLTEEWRRNNPTEVVSNDELLSLHKAFWLQEKEREFQQKGKLPSNDKWRSMYKPPELIDIEKCWQTPETWAWVTIDSISFVTKLAGFEFTKSVKYIEDGEISVIKAENVGKDGFRSTNFSKVAKEVVESLPRSELFGDELLVVFVGAGVGQVGLVPSDQKYFLGPNVAVVRKTTGVYTSKFMELMLRSPLGQKNLLSFSKGAAQPSLSMGQIRQTTIPVPPLNEQELIILKLENLFNKANAIETQVLSALDRVNNLTQSILAKAFCGELTAEWREANTELIIGENSAEALLERIKAERELAKPATKRGRGKS
ncbi:hypothetical protein CA950_14070 [Acinetobacter pittii]|uniref:restriction endonuclease subunit S n=1 Tax=Acinetobacter TaxID=469 RepID=UPI000C1872A9|nr:MULTISPECIES: restriction endonuclease subunit S [Acinetobacter]MCU4473419.1 restriction endonuclease subunit S [Acinetobacter bereziniae]PIL90870.1 hypothetical protein CA950_14070 [Acinetobacter pittii]